MIHITVAELAKITGGRLSHAADPHATIGVGDIVTDSRDSFPGAVYVAKPGEHADGHSFVGAARAVGAVLVLAERETQDDDGADNPSVIVPDAVLALGAVAAYVVERIRAVGELTVIGITGSAGKTTTKDLLAGILATAGPTVAPQGSFNGEIGVPLTVFRADESTRFLIIEMGATGIGHVKYLSSLVKPNIGVVLGVGSAHAGEFGGVENIAIAKGELVEALPADGWAVLNADDFRVSAMAQRTNAHVAFFGTSDGPAGGSQNFVLAHNTHTDEAAHPVIELAFSDTRPLSTDGVQYPVTSGLIGLHHVTNLLAAATVARLLGLDAVDIAAALGGVKAASRWRMERTDRADGVTVINDAYNANPESMRAALRTLAELGSTNPPRRTWAVLGPMYELGDDTIREHDLLGRVAVRLNISRLVVVGAEARPMHVGAVMEGSFGDESVFVADAEEAYELLQRELRSGDVVLIKSSNGAGLRFLGDRIALPSEVSETTEPSTPAERTMDQ